MNTRSAERINGFAVMLRGYASMVGELAGDQWNEGDVSCSVVRRVALPDAFFALDGLLETTLTVLDDFGAFPAVIERELDRYLPFLATTKVLMAAVRAGVGREQAHEAIKENAVAVALEMREKGTDRNDLFERLAADSRLGLSARRAGRPAGRAAGLHRCRPRPGRRGAGASTPSLATDPSAAELPTRTDPLGPRPWRRSSSSPRASTPTPTRNC